ncbi:MAG: hypothetical protein U0556_07290 [Dehalococcoidia bacterium]
MVVEALPRRVSRPAQGRVIGPGLATPAPTVPADDEFPRPTTPAGWPEIKLGLWWLGVAAFVALFSTLFWVVAWPEPRGLAAFRIQIEFAIPLLLAWLGGLASLLTGVVGVLRQRQPARRRVRRPLPRAV